MRRRRLGPGKRFEIYRRVLAYARPYWTRFAIAVVAAVILSATHAGVIYQVKPFINGVLVSKRSELIVPVALAVVILSAISCVANYVSNYLMRWVGQSVVRDLRNEVYEHIHTLSLDFFQKQSTGTLISKMTNDISKVRDIVTRDLADLFKSIFEMIALLFLAFYVNWRFTLVAICVFPLVSIPIVKLGKKMRRTSKEAQRKIADITSLLHEAFSGVRIVKAFGMEPFEVKRFYKQSMKYFGALMRAARVSSLSGPVVEFIGYVSLGLVFIYGGYQVVSGVVTPGDLMAFMIAVARLYDPAKKLSRINASVQRALGAAERVFEIMDTKPAVDEAADAIELAPISSGIEFKGVSFCYGGQPVLKNISFRIPKGKTVAIVGHSGAGKTTIANLIPRFYDPTEGLITIDGIDLRRVTLKSLRSQIGIVTQEVILFNDTVRNNIAYGRADLPDEKIIEAAKAAYAHDFILALPQGYRTNIMEAGSRLSGGERQRIAIARAILKSPPILILDEATSSLDTESEMFIQQAILNLVKNRTVLIIAHRLSTIRAADQILVLDEGRIVEQGRHSDLLRNGGLYRHLYDLQFEDISPRTQTR